jgi:hypothetical protein
LYRKRSKAEDFFFARSSKYAEQIYEAIFMSRPMAWNSGRMAIIMALMLPIIRGQDIKFQYVAIPPSSRHYGWHFYDRPTTL